LQQISASMQTFAFSVSLAQLSKETAVELLYASSDEGAWTIFCRRSACDVFGSAC
jgi:hypothetical protein